MIQTESEYKVVLDHIEALLAAREQGEDVGLELAALECDARGYETELRKGDAPVETETQRASEDFTGEQLGEMLQAVGLPEFGALVVEASTGEFKEAAAFDSLFDEYLLYLKGCNVLDADNNELREIGIGEMAIILSVFYLGGRHHAETDEE